VIARLKSVWTWIWVNHIQKSMAFLLGTTLAYDLYAALMEYPTDLGTLLGHKLYRALRLVCVGIIFLRAMTRSKVEP
jgi:hypothetical protein